jgi:hypothetical protein
MSPFDRRTPSFFNEKYLRPFVAARRTKGYSAMVRGGHDPLGVARADLGLVVHHQNFRA